MSALSLQLELAPRVADEALTAAQWAQLLDVTKKGFVLRNVPHAGMVSANGGLTKVYKFADLPADYQLKLHEQRQRQACPAFADLLDLHRQPRFEPCRELATLPPVTQTLAEQRKEVLAVFWTALERFANLPDKVTRAKEETRAAWLRMFGKAPTEKTIRRWVAAIEERGGPDLAPVEAYAGLKSEHGKSVPHHAARLVAKLEIPLELIHEYKARCSKAGMMHIEAAYRSLVMDWQGGINPVPGLGFAPHPGAAFPFSAGQLRQFAPSLAVRKQGGLGSAAAARVALPHGRNTTAFLRRMERVLLDDSRIDIIATDDLTGRPVELKSQFLIDLGPRRIESWVIRENGNLLATDTDAMLARAFRSAGIAAGDAGYATTVRFERGAVACSSARESFLRGSFPGRLHIERTGMEGGHNYPGAALQSVSGRWMDKAHIESFMRTLAYFIQHVPGQRGGSYARQPAALGLVGKNREAGRLEYTKGSQIHDAALLQYADRAAAWFEGDLETRIAACAANLPETVNGRLRIKSLYPVSWVRDAIREFVAYYNGRTDHRLEGFRRIEYQDAETHALKHRQESPNERAAFLNEVSPTERISEAAVSRLLLRARPVTVKRNGVSVDIAPYTGLRFWSEHSVTCHRAGQLSTGELKLTALVDEDALLHGGPGALTEIYLIGNKEADLKAGQPAQFLEALPLCQPGVIGDAHSLAQSNARLQVVQNRYAAEMVVAAAPHIARQHADLRHNVASLQAAATANDAALRATVPDSPLIRALSAPHEDDAPSTVEPAAPRPTRGEQMQSVEEEYAAHLASLYADQSPQ